MNRLILIFAALAIACAAALAEQATDNKDTARARIDCIEKSLMRALESDIPPLQVTAALTLRQLRAQVPEHDWDWCIIPLMHILNGEDHETSARVVAALTLHKLHSARGDFAIVRNAMFTDDSRVKRYCFLLANARSSKNGSP